MRGRFTPGAHRPRNGASAACWRASTTTRSSGCARRSSRSRRATSCASCSRGSASRPTRACRGAEARSTRSSAQLEGFDAPAGAWESEILPARLADYEPAWLDDRCLAGHAHLDAAAPAQRPRRRRRRPAGAGAHDADHAAAAPPRRVVARRCRCRPIGARPSAAARRRSSTSYRQRRLVLRRAAAALRPAALPARGGAGRTGRARAWSPPTASPACARCSCRRASASRAAAAVVAAAPRVRRWRMPAAGRWSARPAAADRKVDAAAVEHVARALLRRYGVVFWRMLEREASWLPPWRELLRVYRRLESSGEIRGGRFVAGFSGRAVRPARGDRHCCARCAAGRRPTNGRRCRAPIRSTSPAS